MSTSFQDRLNRIGHAPDPVDMIGAGNRASAPPLPPEPEPPTFNQRVRTTVLTYGTLGALWMFPTGWVLGNSDKVESLLLDWGQSTRDAAINADMAWMVAMASLLLFFTYFRYKYPVWSADRGGIADAALFVGGLIAALVGYGPLRVLAEL